MSPGFDLKQALELEKQNVYCVDLPSGEKVELPADIPWAALQKYQGMDEADVSAELISETLELLFGPEDYAKLVEEGMRPGSQVQMGLFMDVMLHVRDMMLGDERVKKLLEESQGSEATQSRTNGIPQDHKPKKAKRSR